MPTSRHHTEWLSLIDVSGPFLAVPVLERVFPHGLDAHDPDHTRLVKMAFEEWEDNQEGDRPSSAIHREWINFVLKQTLGLPDEVLAEGQAIPQTLRATIAEHGETLRPDIVIRNPDGGPSPEKPRLLVQIYQPTQDLEKPLHGRHWKASPATRMMELLHATDVRPGLVTNGNDWMLVDAPKGETTGFITWDATFWAEEPLTLRAFRSLLGVHRFFSVSDGETLEAMLKDSASNQQEVTDRLGYQVREAVEEIIRTLDRIDQDANGGRLAGIPETELYEAALTVMMRLVILFSAEERGLLLLGDPLYDEHYAVSTLVARLQEVADQHGEEVLERRHDAWMRLLSTFRAVYGGVTHERFKLLPYAGKLFDPDRFAFLEGRRTGTTWRDTLQRQEPPLPIDNRTVLHLLRSLQYLEMHGEARRLSFRALDIEQIGHVYEGLLDHTAKRATEPMLSLTATKGDEPEVALPELERLSVKGEAELIKYLKEETGRSENALKKALDAPVDGDAARRLRVAGGNDEALFNRVRPFSGLIRDDTFERPVVIRKGSIFVTAGTDRRSSGTHYTPRSLTEPIVRYTLEPLVYVGPAEGKPKEEWTLRSARDLLDLKICDMACGSGAFLMQACRYLSERLVEAWDDAERQHPGVLGITPEGTPSTGSPREQLIPKDMNERLAYARRIVAQRCLYGVDKNPLAVEMAKLSIWLLPLAKDKPFTFLDHAVRCGDSLAGIRDIRQVEYFQLDLDHASRSLFTGPVMNLVDQAVALRKKIESLPIDTVEDVREKEFLLREAEDKTARLRYAADLLVSVEFQTASSAGQKDDLHNSMAIQAGHFVKSGTVDDFKAAAEKALDGLRTFHWALEYPEVIHGRGGFDGIICNPPFMGGTMISGRLGKRFQAYLSSYGSAKRKSGGRTDLCAYFMLSARELLNDLGGLGFITTNTVSEGDTREVGLDSLIEAGSSIVRAFPSIKWPGKASLEVALLWIRKSKWNGTHVIGADRVKRITSFLTEPGETSGPPRRLVKNQGKACEGSKPLGMGFVLVAEQAHELIKKNKSNELVLRPYLNGQDLNSDPSQAPSRWVITFYDWPLDRETAPRGYDGPVAVDYADCFSIIRELVKPERERRKPNGEYALRQPLPQRWWQHAEKRTAMYRAISQLPRALAVARVSKYVSFAFIPTDIIASEQIVVISDSTFATFSALQSSLHEVWVKEYQSSLETRGRYTPSDCLDTFPFPTKSGDRGAIGEAYYSSRQSCMTLRNEGLTNTYNRFHRLDESNTDVQLLRELHVEMDKAVAAAYGWSDLDLGHGFHETEQGTRFTISDTARREVLGRLLKLNHERYAEEVEQGLHEKKSEHKESGKRALGNGGKRSGNRGRKAMDLPQGPSLNFGDDDVPEPAGNADDDPAPVPISFSQRPPRADQRVQPHAAEESLPRAIPIDQIETDAIMAAFRQAARGRGWLERDALLKHVSVILGYQRLGPKIDESLRGHLRAAIRRRIIEADGPSLVHAGTGTMSDYGLDELRETFRSVMRKGTNYEREDVVHALANYLGFVRVTDSIRQPIKSAINSAIRQGVLGYEGSVIWREE